MADSSLNALWKKSLRLNGISFLLGLVFLVFPLSMQWLLDRVVFGHQHHTLTGIALALVAMVWVEAQLKRSLENNRQTLVLQADAKGINSISNGAVHVSWLGEALFAGITLGVLALISNALIGVLFASLGILSLIHWLAHKRPMATSSGNLALEVGLLRLSGVWVMLIGAWSMMMGQLTPGQWIALSVLFQKITPTCLRTGLALEALYPVMSTLSGKGKRIPRAWPKDQVLSFTFMDDQGQARKRTLPLGGYTSIELAAHEAIKKGALSVLHQLPSELHPQVVEGSGLGRLTPFTPEQIKHHAYVRWVPADLLAELVNPPMQASLRLRWWHDFLNMSSGTDAKLLVLVDARHWFGATNFSRFIKAGQKKNHTLICFDAASDNRTIGEWEMAKCA